MIYYVVNGAVDRLNINEDTLRRALYAENTVLAFSDKEQAAAFAADGVLLLARMIYAVYKVEIEVEPTTSGFPTEEITLLNGTKINASSISINATKKFQEICATLENYTYDLTAPIPKTYFVVCSDLAPNTAVDGEILRNHLFSGKTLAAFEQKLDAVRFTNALRKNPMYEVRITGNKGIIPRNNNTVEIDFDAVEGIEVISASFNHRVYNFETVAVELVDPELVEPISSQTIPVKPAPVQTNPVEPASVQTNPINPTPVEPTSIQSTPVEPTPIQPAPIRQSPQTETFVNEYGNTLLVGCAYFLTTVAVIGSKIIPTLASAAAANGYTVPAAFTATTSLPVVVAAFGISAATFGLGKLIYPYAKSAWQRWTMSDRQRYEADLSVARTQLARLEHSLANKSAEDNQFIAELHQFENNAPEATFDAQGRALQTTNPNKAIVLKFEIKAMSRLTNVAANNRVQTESELLQEARAKFRPVV